MRKLHEISALVCSLIFANTIALNLPFPINQLDAPTLTNLTTNLTNLKYQLLTTPATVVGKNTCYPSDVPISVVGRAACQHAIWKIPLDDTRRTFMPDEFPIRHKVGDCTLTLTLENEERGNWYSVSWAASELWFTCQREYPETLRGATGQAGSRGRIFMRIWYEMQGNVTDEGLTAREIAGKGMERDDEGGGSSGER